VPSGGATGTVSGASQPTTWRTLVAEASVDLPDHEVRRIVEEVSGAAGAELAGLLDDQPTVRAVARFDALVARRRDGEPLQYVLGRWGFRRLDLFVDPRVLIPRPETELVAGHAIEVLRRRGRGQVVVDLGTGSGAIALSIAAEIDDPGLRVWATDVSQQAVDVARANLAGIGRAATRVQIRTGSWYEALPDDLRGAVDVVVTNPPYVHDSFELPNEVAWEPALALRAGEHGLDAYRTIVPGAATWLRPGGVLVMETAPLLAPAVVGMAREAGLVDVTALPDLAHRLRMVVATVPA
jgi:release factor glutamine methyltransferase